MEFSREEMRMIIYAIGEQFEKTMGLGFGHKMPMGWADLKIKLAKEYSRMVDEELKKKKIEKLDHAPEFVTDKNYPFPQQLFPIVREIMIKLNEIVSHINETARQD